MSNHYHRVPSHTAHDNQELEAAFDYSEDEENDDVLSSESQPLRSSATPHTPVRTPVTAPGSYDFENVDYDYPPPGSPPRPSATALPNDHGNSNGLIPSFNLQPAPISHNMWLQRTATRFLPARLRGLFGVTGHPTGPVGGGVNNDGVFANVTAKPAPPVRIQDGDDTYLVPEDSRQEAPPSYASAQADAVPPYWETTVHAPFSPNSSGEMIVDSLPTGSVFTFLWNVAISITFQFVGFLLTYVMHTSHAARLGSRAGLGITLINYGFALRSRLDTPDDSGGGDYTQPTTTSDPNAWFSPHGAYSNSTISTPSNEEEANMLVAGATTEWLSFLLMTIGWFILLTSLLGFWRIKRWEQGIIASQRGSSTAAPQPQTRMSSRLEDVFAIQGMSRIDFLRQGFGMGRAQTEDDEQTRAIMRAEEGDASHGEADPMISSPTSDDPERARATQQALAHERQLRTALIRAGF